MQTVRLKYDVISWITGINDRNLIPLAPVLLNLQFGGCEY